MKKTLLSIIAFVFAVGAFAQSMVEPINQPKAMKPIIMVVPEKVNDEKMVLIARQIAKQIENEMNYPGQVKINLIRESRVVDYAK